MRRFICTPTPRPDLPRNTARAILAQIVEHPEYDIFLSAAGDAVTATAMLSLAPNLMRGGRPYALIEIVVTHAGFRRQGHGRAVMAAAMQAAWDAGAYHIYLLTRRPDPGVHAFSRACGFEEGPKTSYIVRSPDQP